MKMQRLDQTGQNYRKMAGIVKASYEVALSVAKNMKAHANTAKCRIREISVDIADQVTEGIKASKFGLAIQVDESTDITNYCQLLIYDRYIQDNNVKTELLISEELPDTTRGKDIFNLLDKYFKKND